MVGLVQIDLLTPLGITDLFVGMVNKEDCVWDF